MKKNVENIFETLRFDRTSQTLFSDTVFIIIEVAYRTSVFGDAENIEIAYQLTYK